MTTKGFIFDLDGTIYLSERLIPGADRVIRLLRERGGKVVFLSNKALQTRENYAEKLTRLGIPTEPKDVINSSFVMVRYLTRRAPGATVFAVGEFPFIEELLRAGFIISEDPERIEWVIASFDRTFDYRKLCIAYEALKRGARFVATNPDRTCPIEGGELPDCAGVIAHLEAVTLRKVEAIVGKPSPLTIEAILEVMELPAAECLLVGDRIETDIRMGSEAGMKTALVMSGVTDEQTLKASPYQPDYVWPSIAEVCPRFSKRLGRRSMMLTHKELKARALKRADVKSQYDQLDKEFAFLDEFLKARSSAGITQAEIAERIGTTQSAIARLESGSGKHSPSLATLQKYAHALGCRLELRLIKK